MRCSPNEQVSISPSHNPLSATPKTLNTITETPTRAVDSNITVQRAGRSGCTTSDVTGNDTLSLGCQSAQDPHAHIVQGAKQIVVDPSDCFPLTQTRDQYGTAVEYFASKFQRLVLAGLPISGCSSAGGLPVVAAVPESQLHFVEKFLLVEQNLVEAEAKERAGSKKWFGVIDGAHRLKALQLLQEEDPRHFAGYQWSVLEIGWHPLPDLQAFSRMRNQMQKDFVEITVYDVIDSMKVVAENILARNGEIIDPEGTVRPELVREICDSYCGAKSFCSDVMRNLARATLKMSRTVIAHLGRILNSERQDLSSLRGRRAVRRKNPPEKNLSDLDGRVFRNLINTKTFRSTGYFFEKTVTDEDRVHALERLKWKAEETQSFSGIKPAELDQETRKAVAARIELEKLLEAAGLEKPPSGMRQVVWNLLNTDKLDTDVEEHKEKEFLIIPELEEQCRRHSSMHVKTKLDFFKNQRHNTARSRTGNGEATWAQVNVDYIGNDTGEDSAALSQVDAGDDVNNENTDGNVAAGIEDINPSEEGPGQTGRPTGELQDGQLQALEETRQTAYSYTWREYEVKVLTTLSHFDLVVGEPNQSGADVGCSTVFDLKEISEFVQFVRRVLVPGGTCFLILGSHVESYGDWLRAFRESHFETRKYYFIKQSDFVQRDVSDFPQDVVELCLISRAPGEHPQGFKYDLKSDYLHVSNCTHKRKFGAIDQIPPVPAGQRLLEAPRKSLVRPGERAVPLLMEVLLTFCPTDGKVLDVLAGVFTTSLACLALYPNRSISCTSLEKDTDCFSRAYTRLKRVAELALREQERREAEEIRLERENTDETSLIRYDKTYCRRSKRLRKSRVYQGEDESNEESGVSRIDDAGSTINS